MYSGKLSDCYVFFHLFYTLKHVDKGLEVEHIFGYKLLSDVFSCFVVNELIAFRKKGDSY